MATYIPCPKPACARNSSIDELPYSIADAYDRILVGAFDCFNGASYIEDVHAILDDRWSPDSIGTIETQIALFHVFLEEQVVGKEEKLHQYAEKRLEHLGQKLT